MAPLGKGRKSRTDKGGKPLTAAQVRKRFKLSADDVKDLAKYGAATVTKGRYSAEKVKAWIAARMTRQDAAALLGISERSLGLYHLQWKRQGYQWGSGRPGPGSLGWFPIEDIKEWIAKQNFQVGRPSNSSTTRREQLDDLEIADREIELQIKLGKILDADEAATFFGRVVATGRALLEALPDKILTRLPADLSEEVRQRIRTDAAADCADCFAVLKELTLGDEDAIAEELDDNDG